MLHRVPRILNGQYESSLREMRKIKTRRFLLAIVVASLPAMMVPARAATAASWTLASSSFSDSFTTQPFIGNGYLGARIPAAGSGFVGAEGIQTWPTFAERFTNYPVNGVYAQEPSPFGDKEVLASVPTWSTMTFGTGIDTFSTSAASSSVSNYRQALDLRTGTVTTTGVWRDSQNRATDFRISVLTSEADEHRALVTLTLVPRFTGAMTVTGTIDGTGARRTFPGNAGTDITTHRSYVVSSTVAIGTQVAEDQVLQPGDGVHLVGDIAQGNAATQTAGERLTFPVLADHSYSFTKFVSVATSRDSATPAETAQADVADAVRGGAALLEGRSAAAWAARWRHSILLPRTTSLQQVVRAQEFYLMASVRRDGSAIVPPSGLSADSYAGAVFWDADTWMFPALLAQQPDLARNMENFRFDTLPAARQNAQILGHPGAFYSWTSGPVGSLDQDCYGTTVAAGRVIADVNRSCTTEIHLQGDIALAQWQVYEATGDRGWLRTRGWPVLEALAQFWASRAEPQSNGRYALTGVQPPDEYEFQVSNEAYTNAIAANALRVATRAARVLRLQTPASWVTIAKGLEAAIPYDAHAKYHPEYDGYSGAQVKQADVVMLTYPLGFPMPKQVARNDLDFYAANTAPLGPAMTDAIHSIDTSQLGLPGCSAWTYVRRASDPYLRPPYDQFSETRPPDTASAFDFLTGVGGYLQTFVYGFTGLRFGTAAVTLNPSLPPQLPALRLPGITWHGRHFTIAMTRRRTVVTLTSGAPMKVRTPRGRRTLRRHRALILGTRRPDTKRQGNLALCRSAGASSEVAGNPALAAVDGTAATSWQAAGAQATLTLPLGGRQKISRVIVGRAGSSGFAYTVETSPDGRRWSAVATGSAASPSETVTFPARRARYVRLNFPGGLNAATPAIAELQVRR